MNAMKIHSHFRWLRVALWIALPVVVFAQAAPPGTPVPVAVDSPIPPAATQPAEVDAAAEVDAPVPGNRVFLIPINTEINDITFRRIRSAIAAARAASCDVIVFEMDTPGGAVGAALDICRAIKDLSDVHTIAWVHREAISAGAMISVACDEIIIASMSKIGDCAPIMISPEGGLQQLGGTEREKISTYIRAEFREAAHRNGYSVALCNAMVMLGPAIYKVWDVSSGQIEFITSKQLYEYGLTDPHAEGKPRTLDQVNQAATDTWRLETEVLEPDRLLTMLTDEAIELGFAQPTKVEDEAALATYTEAGNGVITRIDPTWSELLAAFLTSPVLRGILMLVLLMGFYAEMNSPGIGLPGAVALVALIVLIGAPYVAGMANWVEVLIILLGVGLLFVEIFVIPGFGLAGILGLTCILLGLVLTFAPAEGGDSPMPTIPELQYTWDGLINGVITVLVSMCAALVGIYFISKYYGRIPVVSRLVLEAQQPVETAASAGGNIAEAQRTAVGIAGMKVGDTGVVTAALRPVGRARIDEHMVDVVTLGDHIERDARVRVVEVHGNRIVVEEA